MSDTARFWCIVPAAGVGKRMGGPTSKQYMTFPAVTTLRANSTRSFGSDTRIAYDTDVELSSDCESQATPITIIETTLQRLLSIECIETIVVSVGAEDELWAKLNISMHPKIEHTRGGDQRCHSVLNGLIKLKQWAADKDWVLVHDVARPCVRSADIERLIREVTRNSEGGVLGYPVRDTMKRTNDKGRIIETVERNQLWHAMTPQMFRVGPLLSALQACLAEGLVVTDESAAMERVGISPILVEGAFDNIKITRSEDLQLAALIIATQRHKQS